MSHPFSLSSSPRKKLLDSHFFPPSHLNHFISLPDFSSLAPSLYPPPTPPTKVSVSILHRRWCKTFFLSLAAAMAAAAAMAETPPSILLSSAPPPRSCPFRFAFLIFTVELQGFRFKRRGKNTARISLLSDCHPSLLAGKTDRLQFRVQDRPS